MQAFRSLLLIIMGLISSSLHALLYCFGKSTISFLHNFVALLSRVDPIFKSFNKLDLAMRLRSFLHSLSFCHAIVLVLDFKLTCFCFTIVTYIFSLLLFIYRWSWSQFSFICLWSKYWWTINWTTPCHCK